MTTGKLVAITVITGLLYGCARTEKVMIVSMPKKWLSGEYFDCFARIGSAAATLECLTVSAEPEQGTHTLRVKFKPDAPDEVVTDAQIQKGFWRCQIVQDQDSEEYSLNCSPAETPAAAPTAVLTPPAPPSPPETPEQKKADYELAVGILGGLGIVFVVTVLLASKGPTETSWGKLK